MNRREFMARLEQLLAGITEEERTDALQYYEDYFNDAGEENEQKVIEELESPEKVAAIIRSNLQENSGENGEYTECGYTDERFEYRETPAARGEDTKQDRRYSSCHDKAEDAYAYNGTENAEKYAISPKMNTFLKVVLVLLIIIACPVVIPLVIGVAAALIGIVVGVFAIFAAFVIAAAAIAAAGLCIIAVGVVRLGMMFPSAILTVGVGLLLFTLGLIGTVATVRLCMVMYPAIFRIIVKICRWPFHRRKAVA